MTSISSKEDRSNFGLRVMSYHFSTSEYDALKHLVIWRMPPKVLESSSTQKMRHDKTIMFQKLEIRSSVLSTPF